jgi:hypothetical protein
MEPWTLATFGHVYIPHQDPPKTDYAIVLLTPLLIDAQGVRRWDLRV